MAEKKAAEKKVAEKPVAKKPAAKKVAEAVEKAEKVVRSPLPRSLRQRRPQRSSSSLLSAERSLVLKSLPVPAMWIRFT